MSGYTRIANQLFDPITGEPAGWVDGNGVERGYVGVWAKRPLAQNFPVGSIITITDVPLGGRSQWYSDGTNWRPMGGRLALVSLGGSVAAPVSTYTTAGGAAFLLPNTSVKIPAGMLIPTKSVLRVSALWSKLGSAAGIACTVTIGTGNSISDTQLDGTFIGAAATAEYNMQRDISFPTSTSANSPNVTVTVGGSAGAVADVTGSTNINTAADMWVNLGSNSVSTTDGLCLSRYMVELFQ